MDPIQKPFQGWNPIRPGKLARLKSKLQAEGNTDPDIRDITRLSGLSEAQGYKYLKAIRAGPGESAPEK